MGIPSYFIHVVKNHKKIIKLLKNTELLIDNLYIDSNSIIYDALYKIEYKSNEQFEKELIKIVCLKIQYYINLINPKNKVLVAFDGVAPVAKLEQQRNRRYKTWYTKEYIKEDKNSKDQKNWDTTAITPGTKFMEDLLKGINEYFLSNKKKNNNIEVMISGSNESGEGEHKIYSYIRDNKDYHRDTNTVIYGLDADLIMLTLVHTKISKNMYLFRETPHFIKSVDCDLMPDQNYVLDIYELGEKIKLEMINNDNVNKENIYDYIFLCFFLGNDFMPHFPSLNIRTNGINILIETYNNLFGNTNNVLIDMNKVHWKNLRKFIEELAKNEDTYLTEEMKNRSKM